MSARKTQENKAEILENLLESHPVHAAEMEKKSGRIAIILKKHGILPEELQSLKSGNFQGHFKKILPRELAGLPRDLYPKVIDMALLKAGMAPDKPGSHTSRATDGKRAGISPAM